MRKTLYNITQEYMQAYEAMYSDEELTEDVIRDTLAGMSSDVNNKIINTAAIVKCMEADIEAIRQAELDMQARRKRLERRIQWLKSNIMNAMLNTGIFEVKHTEFDVKLGVSPVSVKIDSSAKLPNQYLRIKTEPDKQALKLALLEGKEIAGVHLVKETNLKIK